MSLRLLASLLALVALALPAHAEDDPELIFKKATEFRLLSPDSKLATYALDDPLVEGVTCYFTIPEVGGWKGWAGFAEERSEVSIQCVQTGPVTIKDKFAQGEAMYRMRRSLFFKHLNLVRGCDAKRNVLVYLAYSDKLISGSPQNSTSSVAIMPWGNSPAPRCSDFVTK
ncbi:MAG: CreA family protein [Hyphomicrobiales bacterium]